MRLGAQHLQLLGRHGQREIGEERAVEIIDQLLVGHVRIHGVAALRPQRALGADHGGADVASVAVIVGGLDSQARAMSSSGAGTSAL